MQGQNEIGTPTECPQPNFTKSPINQPILNSFIEHIQKTKTEIYKQIETQIYNKIGSVWLKSLKKMLQRANKIIKMSIKRIKKQDDRF